MSPSLKFARLGPFESVQADREPVKPTPSKAVKTGSYAHGLSMAATVSGGLHENLGYHQR